jgi:hypothetical protein
MKNIHIIPTDSPSRLIKDVWNNTFSIVENFNTSHTDFKAQYIYITSDEEIKDGDFIFEADTNCINIADRDYCRNEFDFKIVLTTDGDLIKYGVQSIDDEFLQWFVNNSSCVEVKIRKNPKVNAVVKGLGIKSFSNGYRIIKPKSELASKLKELLDGMSQEEFDEEWKKITDLKLEGPSMIEDPNQHAELINDNIEEFDKAIELFEQEQKQHIIVHKDETEHLLSTESNKKRLLQDVEKKQEQKQHLIDMMKGDEELGLYEETTKCYCGHTTYCDCGPEEPKQEITLEEVFNEEKVKGVKELIDKHKQETIEEAAKKYVEINVAKNAAKLMYKEHFIAGAKWQREKLCDSELIQRIRASKSDAEARRIIRTF